MTSSHTWHPEYGAWSSKDRLRAVELNLWGVSTAEVALLYHVHPCTVRKWVHMAATRERPWQLHPPLAPNLTR